MANCKAVPTRGLGSTMFFRFGSWFSKVVGGLVRYLGTRFGWLFDETRRCYRHLEKQLNKEEELCQVGFLWLMAHIARRQGWHWKLLSKLKDSPVKPAGDNICAVMYAVCKDAWRRGKADPGLCLPAYISCMLGEVELDVLAPDTLHAKIVVAVDGELRECILPPACRLARRA